MNNYDHDDSRLRGESRREAIDDLRDELLKDKDDLIEVATEHLKKGRIDAKFKPMVATVVDLHKRGAPISEARWSAIAGVVAFIEIDDQE